MKNRAIDRVLRINRPVTFSRRIVRSRTDVIPTQYRRDTDVAPQGAGDTKYG